MYICLAVILIEIFLFSWGFTCKLNFYVNHKTYIKFIYLFAKLFIVLVKISLPLIQEIVRPFLHDVNNALNSFTQKENYLQKKKKKEVLSKKTYHTKIFSKTVCAHSHFTLAFTHQYLLSNISKPLRWHICRKNVGAMAIWISFLVFTSALSQLELTESCISFKIFVTH